MGIEIHIISFNCRRITRCHVGGFANQATLHTSNKPIALSFRLSLLPFFGWGAFKGIALWRGKPSGYRWARILFALQIPAFSIGRLSYEFSTGISARVLFGHSNRQFMADIGSSLNFLISPEPQGWMLGINISVALIRLYSFITCDSGLHRIMITSRGAKAKTVLSRRR